MRRKWEREWAHKSAIRATRSTDVAEVQSNALQYPGTASENGMSPLGTVGSLVSRQLTDELYSYGYFYPDGERTVRTDWSSFSSPSRTKKKERIRPMERSSEGEDVQLPDEESLEREVVHAEEDNGDTEQVDGAMLEGIGRILSTLDDLHQPINEEDKTATRAPSFFEKRHARRYGSRSNESLSVKAAEDVYIAALARSGRRSVEEASGSQSRSKSARHLTIPYFKPFELGEVVQPRERGENLVAHHDSPAFDERSCLPAYPCFLPKKAEVLWFLDPNLHERGQEVVMPGDCRLKLELEVQKQRAELSVLKDRWWAENEKEWKKLRWCEVVAFERCEELRRKRDAYLAVCDVLLKQLRHSTKERKTRENVHPYPELKPTRAIDVES
eukprot:GEMP01047627.1.p1 GENE.GEMP01047627.1~~GEMP01047627.1.p1  ORF type:complete len:386 (+),score=76.27 GEMP01047627.1:307-1464(+)